MPASNPVAFANIMP